MGSAMAANLVRKSVEVMVYDLTHEATREFAAELGCHVAASRQELASFCSLMILMLSDGEIVRRFLMEGTENDQAPISLMHPGTAILNMSSSHPIGTRELGKEMSKRGDIVG